ncbi:hypothetical protein N431DRAFT_440063 [Stipitochalara longipes BDJ]|nr:hypothetical protein N431DRAFT_440063 [Stipitochalara longipes BDJ]
MAKLAVLSNDSLQLSATLCFTAFETADLAIAATGSENRTEPIPQYDSEKQLYQYSQIRKQLGQPNDQAPLFSESNSNRGILELTKRDSWVPGPENHYEGNPSDGSIGRTSWPLNFVNMLGPIGEGSDNPLIVGGGQPCTALMYLGIRDSEVWTGISSLRADPSLIALGQKILQQGGSVAFALQSIMTVLTGIAYYDQLQQFNGEGTVIQSDFVLVTAPHYYKGFFAVLSVVIAHLTLLSVILRLFLARTKVSALGNSWHTVSQLQGEELRDVIAHSSLRTDSEVAKTNVGQELRMRFVGIRLSHNKERTEVVRSF